MGPVPKLCNALQAVRRCAASLQIAVVGLLCLVLAACAVGGTGMTLPPSDATAESKQRPATTAGASKGATKVAMVLPLTAGGQVGIIARAMKQAGELALFELDDPGFELIVKDDRGTPEGAAAAANEAIAEKSQLILGPLFAQSVAAAAPAATKSGIPIIAFSNDRRVAQRGVHVLGFQADQEVERILGYVAQQKRQRLVALLPDDDYGQTIDTTLGRNRSGLEIVAIERFGGTGTALLEPIRKLADLARAGGDNGGFDTMLIAAGPETLSSIGSMITFTKLDTARVKLIGTGGFDHPTLGRDKAFVGGWFPAPDPRNWQAFAEKFQRTYGMAPPRVASLAYDATTIAIGLSKGPPATRFTDASLTRASGFNGIDGPVRLTSTGVAERRLAVLEVQSFGAVVLDAAGAPPPDNGTN